MLCSDTVATSVYNNNGRNGIRQNNKKKVQQREMEQVYGGNVYS